MGEIKINQSASDLQVARQWPNLIRFVRDILSSFSIGLFLQACTPIDVYDRPNRNSEIVNSGGRDKLLVMGTGPDNGAFLGLGNTLCNAVNSYRSKTLVRCVPVLTAGSSFNVHAVANRALQIGLSHEAVAAEIFDDPNTRGGDDLRSVVILYSTPISIMVRKASAIRSVGDLRRGVVNLGVKGSGTNANAMKILAGLGLDETDLPRKQYLSPSSTIEAFCQGKVDVVFNTQPHPSPLYRQLRECGGEFISMSPELLQNMRADNPSLRPSQIPAGIYDAQQQAVQTLESREVLIVNASVDDESVYRLAKILLNEQDRMAISQPQLAITRSTSFEEMVAMSVPIHPGALRALKEFHQ